MCGRLWCRDCQVVFGWLLSGCDDPAIMVFGWLLSGCDDPVIMVFGWLLSDCDDPVIMVFVPGVEYGFLCEDSVM